MKYQGALDQNTRFGYWTLAFQADTVQVVNYTPEMVYLRIGDHQQATPQSYHHIIGPMTAMTFPVNSRLFSASLGPVYVGGYTAPYTQRLDIIWTAEELPNNAAQFSLAQTTVPQPVPIAQILGQAGPFTITFPPFPARSRWLRLHWQYLNTDVVPLDSLVMRVSYGPTGLAPIGVAGSVLFDRSPGAANIGNFSDFYVRPGDDITIDLYSIGAAADVWNVGIWYEYLDQPSLIFPRAYRMAHRAYNYYNTGALPQHTVRVLSDLVLGATGLVAIGFAYQINADVLVEDGSYKFLDGVSNSPLAEFNLVFPSTDLTVNPNALWAPSISFTTVDQVTAAGVVQVGTQVPFGGYYKRTTAHPFTIKITRPIEFTAPAGIHIEWSHETHATLDLQHFTFEYLAPL